MAAKPKIKKVPISERALIQRINRRLKQDGEMLRSARGTWHQGRWYPDSNLGRYYIIDFMRNFVIHVRVDLEAYGRELEVLREWEELQAEA
jgi:hypothetical protein